MFSPPVQRLLYPCCVQTLLFKGGHKTKPVKILADVTGVLKPVQPRLANGRQMYAYHKQGATIRTVQNLQVTLSLR